MNFNLEIFESADGKRNLKDVSLLSPMTQTIKLRTGHETGYLGLDVDNPNCENNKKLLSLISKDDFIVYSSQYRLDDVFAGKCKYKVIFKYQISKDLPKSKDNQAIELFYKKGSPLAIAGKRHDFDSNGNRYEYLFNRPLSEARELFFDINDVLEKKIKEFKLGKKETILKSKKQKQQEIDFKDSILSEEADLEKADIGEFKRVVSPYVLIEGVIEIKNDSLLTFQCPFKLEHSKKNYACAFKKKGKYVIKCQGEVCKHEIVNLNKKIEEQHLGSYDFPKVKGVDWDE